MTMSTRKASTRAAAELIQQVESGQVDAFSFDVDDVMGQTDCPDGCSVEPDGTCYHGYESAALTAGLI